MKIIAITGMPGAGKTTVAQFMKDMGFQIYSMGDVVRGEIEKMGPEKSSISVGQLASDMREKHGPDIWAKKTIEVTKKGQNKTFTIIEGCRSKMEAEAFKREFGEDFVIISVKSSQEKRFERLSSRGRNDDIKTLEEFKKRDKRELSWGIGDLISIADHVIVNDGSFDDLKKQTKNLIKEIVGE